MKTIEQSSVLSPLPRASRAERSELDGERVRYEVSEAKVRGEVITNPSEPDTTIHPTPETLRHRHQIQARQTRARRVIHHRRSK